MIRSLFLLLCTTFTLSVYSQIVEDIKLDTVSQKVIVDFIIEGNKLTKERIILRELTLEKGDRLFWSNLKAGMEQSENNIMNTGLFNFVKVQPIQIDNENVLVNIQVQERWYIYPLPIFEMAETNFNTWWKEKDLRRLNYGVSVVHKNFRGLNERISMTLRFGYTKKFSFRYFIPNINKAQTLGLDLTAGYYENNEIVYKTENNERVYYKGPDTHARSYMQYKAGLVYRGDLYFRHYFNLVLYDAQVRDSVTILQPDYFAGRESRSKYLSAQYTLTYDTRDYHQYPLEGKYFQASVQQDGLGLLNKKGLSLFTSYSSFRQYFKTGKRTYFAYSLTGKVNWDNELPYYLTQGLGYNDIVRGYEYYVIDGTKYALAKTNFKVEILKPKTIHLPLIPSKKFNKTFIAIYGNIFAETGYVYGKQFEEENSLVNKYLYSFGAGLDVVTYYDKVMRLEVTRNGLGETGFFVHFKQAF